MKEVKLGRNIARSLSAERAEALARAMETGEVMKFEMQGDYVAISIDGVEYARLHKLSLLKPDEDIASN